MTAKKDPHADLFAEADAIAERDDLSPQVRVQADAYTKQREGSLAVPFAKALVRSDALYSVEAAAAADDLGSLTVGDLKAEIDRRNDGREDADLITPASKRKDDLVAALKADDERS